MILSNAKIWISDGFKDGHLFIDESSGKILDIRSKKPNNEAQSGLKINLKGNFVIPSLIDIHCHLRDFKEAHKETFKTGAKAAAAGGFTHIFDMPNKNPPVISIKEIHEISQITRKIDEIEIIPYLLLNERTESPLVYKYPFLKAYLGHTTGEFLTTISHIEDFLPNSTSFLSVHCEDDNLIDKSKIEMPDDLKNHCYIRGPDTELNSISSLIHIKNRIKITASLHVAHITLYKSVVMLKREEISYEVTPHHLLLNTKDYQRLGTWGKMNPPLRSKSEQGKLFSSFLHGQIPIVATDHAPHTKEEKEISHLNGVPGLETALPALLNRLQPLDITKFRLVIDALALNPRKLMNFSSKGIIAVGEIADLTVIDRNLVKTVNGDELFTKCKWSPWEREKLQGWPVLTVHKGKITYNNL